MATNIVDNSLQFIHRIIDSYSMVFVACGLNHKTAPLAVREQVALSADMQDTMLNNLVDMAGVHEIAILSTCNRTEIYCDVDDPTQIVPLFAQKHSIPAETLLPYFYVYPELEGIRHTLRVASGLDSMMLGEPQILGQMKQAYQQACRVGTIKQTLRPVFQYIFSASKRVRHRSGIGNNPVSIAFAAVQLVGQLYSDYQNLNVFIIGSGETASLVAKYLHKQGVKRFMVASRHRKNAQLLAKQFSGEALTIADILHYLPQADVVISATACPIPFINKELVAHAIQQRKTQAPMFFLDLSVPRDIESDVSELPHVHLYNMDDLQNMIERGMNERCAKAQEAEQLIECELDHYIRWHRSLKANTVICNYRTQMQQLALRELERATKRLTRGHCQHRVLNELCDRLVNKLTHSPTVGLRQAAQDNREELLDLAKYLFTGSNA